MPEGHWHGPGVLGGGFRCLSLDGTAGDIAGSIRRLGNSDTTDFGIRVQPRPPRLSLSHGVELAPWHSCQLRVRAALGGEARVRVRAPNLNAARRAEFAT